MALTKTTKKTSSIIKTRSQSRTDSRTIAPAPVATATGRTTGTNVRTNDRTIDVAPTPVVTTTTNPVDLFAGRPTTGTLKDPPPAAAPITGMKPTPRDLDDDAKKPAAKPKPKGRPKKVVAPKAPTRKPRKPRTDPADDLVDPMSRVHVGDAGGLARAGGNDPVLADMDYSNPEQDPEQPDDEPQPKKKTRRAVE